MSAVYKREVPLYDKLVALVNQVNDETLALDPMLHASLLATDQLSSLPLERHGAIRLGTAEEMSILGRMLAVMGMFPTGYYDLSEAGVPVHSTCFRAHPEAELAKSPFRLFTSLLRLELISSEELRQLASATLASRQIFSDQALELLDVAEKHGGLTAEQAQVFVEALMDTFCWNSVANITQSEYAKLWAENRLLADVVAFKGPHINHLTPRTLNLDNVQVGMKEWDIDRKDAIEGPPPRKCAILLRQSSFKALEEKVLFPNESPLLTSAKRARGESTKTDSFTQGHHKARFGEIEQRGAALTPKGRALYDECLRSARKAHLTANDPEYGAHFAAFPDDWNTLRKEGLVWFTYHVPSEPKQLHYTQDGELESLIAAGYIIAEPQTYQDFLPVSAAGIFQSNLDTYEPDGPKVQEIDHSDREGLEEALGQPIKSEMQIYEDVQNSSLEMALKVYGLPFQRDRPYLENGIWQL